MGPHPSFSSNRIIPEFYSELDAEMHAHTVMKAAGIGQETQIAEVHGRYIEMLVTGPRYWFAATMDALENRSEPKDFFATYRAVCELRIRIIMQLTKQNQKQYSSEQLQNSIGLFDGHFIEGLCGPDGLETRRLIETYDSLSFQDSPTQVYTALRKVAEAGVITDPFVATLATNILAAVSYFNPDLVLADYAPSRMRIANALRLDSR